MSPGPKRSRRARRTAIGLPVLAMLVVAGIGVALWRASSIVTPLLHNWAVQTVAEQSSGVYRLDLSRVHLNWLKRQVRIDSVQFGTNRAANARRPHPLSDLTIALYNCTISGVRLTTLIRGAGLVAQSLGCRVGNVAVVVARRVPGTGAATPHPFLVFSSGLRLPSLLPRIKISHIAFPALGLDFRLPRARRGETRLQLEHLQWRMADLAIDPADSSAAARPLFSRNIELVAENIVVHPDSTTSLRVGVLATNVSDSTLEARNVAYAPTLSQPDFARLHPTRRDYITMTAGWIRAQGIDLGALALGEGTLARHVAVDSFRAEVTMDLRRPPRYQVSRSPQAWLAGLDQSLSLDSVVLRDGEIVYREDHPGHVRPGAITFAGFQATAVNVHHLDGRRTRGDAMTLTTTSRLQNVGRFDVQFTIPLDAPSFDMTFRGTLGAMPATDLNRFIEDAFAWKIAKGQIGEIKFAAAVKHGVAAGTATPLYTDLSVDVTRRGSKGIMATGGIVGHTMRNIASLAANATKVKDNNPEHHKDPPRIGAIYHVFNGQETLPAYLWASLRDGLMSVILK